MKNLGETVSAMLSTDYEERFRAQYHQLRIRLVRLHNMIVRYEAGTLDFEPKCSLDLLKKQKKAMGEYLYSLQVRADIEGIALYREDDFCVVQEEP